MPNPLLRLLLIDSDPIFRLGLVTGLAAWPDVTVVAEAETAELGLELLTTLLIPAAEVTVEPPAGSEAVDVLLLDLSLGLGSGGMTGLAMCQAVRSRYPSLPIVLLTASRDRLVLESARQLGVHAYCPKGLPVAELIELLRRVQGGGSDWSHLPALPLARPVSLAIQAPPPASPLTQAGRDGMRQMAGAIADLNRQLQTPGLTAMDRLVLEGRRRELRAAQWLVKTVFKLEEEAGGDRSGVSSGRSTPSTPISPPSPPPTAPTINVSFNPRPNDPPATPTQRDVQLNAATLQSRLLDITLSKAESGLHNLTEFPLEIDILRPQKRQELLYLILRKLEEQLAELRFSQVKLEQLASKRQQLLVDLWQDTITDFFGKYYTVQVGDIPALALQTGQLVGEQTVEVVPMLLRDQALVQTAILDRIPFVSELLSHLLFHTPLNIDNDTYAAGSPEALERAEVLLQNLVIQLGNGVMQPLLNHFANVEAIKHSLYDRRLLSTREIERFRNELSWKYRVDYYVGEPRAIFESCYWLMILSGAGIKRIAIYAPRTQELAELRNIRLAVTLAFELRDAIAPRLRATLAFVGNGMVYVLTQVIGRGIGLIGRGILQGIGTSLQDIRPSRRRK